MGKKLTPEEIAALMSDDINDNNGLKPGQSFLEGAGVHTRSDDYVSTGGSYYIPEQYKSKKPIMEVVNHGGFPVMDSKPIAPVIHTPQPPTPQVPKPAPNFGYQPRTLSI